MSKSTMKAGTASADARISAEKKVAAEVEKSAKAQEKSLTTAIKSAEKNFTASEKEKSKVAKAEAAQRAKDLEGSLRAIRAANDAEARDFEKNEQAKTRIAKAEATKRSETIKSIAGGAGNLVGGAVSRTMRVGGRIAQGLVLGGGFMVADAVHTRIKEEEAVGTSVRAAAYKGGLGIKEFDTAGRAAAIATGTTAEKTFEGMDAVIRKTGNLPAAIAMIKDLAKYSASTGAEMSDLGGIAGIVFEHMHGDIGKTNDVMLKLIGQAKHGVIDMRDLGQYGGRLVGSAELFEGSTAKNIETFGAFAQLSERKGNKVTAGEATESAARLFDEIERHASKIEKLTGTPVLGAGGKLRDPTTLLIDVLAASAVKHKGNVLAEVPNLFGRQAGAVEVALGQSFTEASGGKYDAASIAKGRAAAAAAVESFRTPATKEEVENDVAAKLLETQSQLNVAMEEFRKKIGDELLPLMKPLIEQLTKIIPTITNVIKFFTDGSLTGGLAKLIGAVFLAELTKGGISMAASKGTTAILKLIGDLLLGKKAAPLVEDVAANVLDKGSRAGGVLPFLGSAFAGVTAGIAGIAGVGVAGALGAAYYGQKEGEKGNALVQKAMQMPEGTAEEKAAKLAVMGPLVERGEHALILGRQGRGELGVAGMDAYNADSKGRSDLQMLNLATQSLSALKNNADLLARSLQSAADEAAGFKLPGDLSTAIVHPPGPGGIWKDTGASRDND